MSAIRPSPIPIPRCRSQTVYLRLHSIHFIHQRRRRRWNPRSEAEDTAVESTARSPEAAGGKMVVELVGAFNEVTERMNSVWLSTSSSRLLFKALKLSIPILQSLPLASDGRSPLSKALSLSILLADLQVPLSLDLGLGIRIIGSGFWVQSHYPHSDLIVFMFGPVWLIIFQVSNKFYYYLISILDPKLSSVNDIPE